MFSLIVWLKILEMSILLAVSRVDEIEKREKVTQIHTRINNNDQKLSESTKRSVQIMKEKRERKMLYRSCVINTLFYYWSGKKRVVRKNPVATFVQWNSRPNISNSIALWDLNGYRKSSIIITCYSVNIVDRQINYCNKKNTKKSVAAWPKVYISNMLIIYQNLDVLFSLLAISILSFSSTLRFFLFCFLLILCLRN